MSERKINLEEILKSFLIVEAMKLNNPDYTFNMVLSAMKEACRQTLELAAENAKAFDTIHSWNTPSIDAQSILNTIKQIE